VAGLPCPTGAVGCGLVLAPFDMVVGAGAIPPLTKRGPAVTVTTSSLGATSERGEPMFVSGIGAGKSVWFKVRACVCGGACVGHGCTPCARL
jgi:hypothetical protein